MKYRGIWSRLSICAGMERNMESRNGTGASVSGSFSLSRRRSRGSSLRDSSSGGCEVEDGDQGNGRRERPRRRRRMGSSESFHVDRHEDGDGSSEESLDEEQEDEDEPIRASGGGSAASRRSGRGKPQWKGNDEVIGVSVPRKARSASAKRLQDSFSTVRQASSASPARTSARSVSPTSSNASMKAGKRMKSVSMKKPPKTSKVSISESEVEVAAQFLYFLNCLQSQSSPTKTETYQSFSPKHDSRNNLSNEDYLSAAAKAASPMSTPICPSSSLQPVVLPLHPSSTHVPTIMALKRKKPRVIQVESSENPAVMVACSSDPCGSSLAGNSISSIPASSAMKLEAENHDQKLEIVSLKVDNNLELRSPCSLKADTLSVSSSLETSIAKEALQLEEKPTSSPVETKPLMPTEMKLDSAISSSMEENRTIDANCQSFPDQIHRVTQQEPSSCSQGLPSLTTEDAKLEASKMSCPVSTAVEGVKGIKFEIDLMAPPENCYPDECLPDSADTSVQDHEPSSVTDLSAKGQEEKRLEQDCGLLDSEEKIQTKDAVEKQFDNVKKAEPCNNDEKTLEKAGNKQQSQKVPKSTARQEERTAPPIGIMTSSSTPVPIPLPGWPSGLPPFGYLGSNPANLSGVPSIQGATSMERSSVIPNGPFIMLPRPRPNRCAAHLFIAHLIHYQQQLARLNPFWHAAGSAALYGARPYNMKLLPPSDALLLGGSNIRNPNLPASTSLGSGSLTTLNSHNSKEKASNSFEDAQRKQPILPLSVQQGAAFMFPFTQPRTGETKSSSSAENAGLMPASGAAAAAASASVNKFSNMPAITDPQCLAMIQSSYSFPIPPSYRAHVNTQQQPTPPFFGGSFYPSQLMQLQSHSLPQTQIKAQGQHRFPPSKSIPESLCTEPEPTGKSEDGTDNRVPVSHKQLQAPNLPGNSSLQPNLPQNFPLMGTNLGGKQQTPSDPGLQMSLKAMEAARSVPSAHAMLQTMPDMSRNHYQLGNHFHIQAANSSKAPAKAAAKVSDKCPDSIHPQLTMAAMQQLQKQAMALPKPSAPAVSSSASSGAMAYADRIPMVYSSVGSNFPAASMGFPNMQSPQQWKLPSSQRVAQVGPSGNATIQSAVSAGVVAKSNSGTPSGEATKLPSSPVNSSRKAITPGPPVLTQSTQTQTLGKAPQLLSNSEPVQTTGSTSLSQKRYADPNSATQSMFPGSLNSRRPLSQQMQSGSPVMSVASASSYGGKGPIVYPMAGASYAKPAANLPVKSAEQKPAAA